MYESGTGRYVLRHPDVTAYRRATAYRDAPQNGGVGVDNHVVFQNRVSRNAFDGVSVVVEREAFGSERDSLIELYVVADDASCPYHDARAVVDSEVVADSGGGMDVDAGLGMRHFRDDTRNQRHAQ